MPPQLMRGVLLASSVLIPLLVSEAWAQTALPQIVVEAPQRPPPARPKPAPRPAVTPVQPDANAVIATQNTQLDVARENLSPRVGTSTFDMNRAFIETLPQGTDGPIDKVLLQAPGLSKAP